MIAIGIDIGGTSIKFAAVTCCGEVKEKFVQEVEKGEDQKTTIKKLIKNVKKYIKDQKLARVVGIGLGIPGSIDSKAGVVSYSNNLKWEDLHIVEMFKKEIDLPVRITNDANAAALGEKVFGAGKKYQDVVMITLGTGVGSGIICGGKIYEGLNGKGAEIGHSSLIYDNGLPCTCGRRGCFEMYASATALIRQTNEAMEQNKNSLLWEEAKKEGKVNGKVAFNAAKAGDETAIKVIDKYVEYLSEGLLNVCNIFRPECIVLSGGIANQGDYLVDKVKAYCAKYDYGYPNSPVTEIKVAEIGYDSGIIGAACLFF